jgi:Flp pilus assembly protein TadG
MLELGFAKSDRLSLVRRLLRRLWDESGQSLIEVYVILPILMLILVGAVEMGRVAYASIEVMNAAAAGVQYGAQNPITAGDSAGINVVAQNDAADITLSSVNASRTCVCSAPGSSVIACPTTGTVCSGSNLETILTVTTQASFNPGFRLPGFPASFTLQGKAVQKVLQ